MKDLHDWITVKRLFAKGVKIKQIARQLQISKNTVKSILRKKGEPKYLRKTYPSKVESYKEQIRTWYLEPEYNFIGTRIFRELKNLDYHGSIGPLYRYLKTLKEEKSQISAKATVRIETPMGDQAQFDWSPYTVIIGTDKVEVNCFTMILSASRMKSIVFSLTADADAIYEAIQELFDDLKGVTAELIIDNPKALVLENIPGKPPVYNFNALRLANHLGTELNACKPYRARTKGKIEKPYQYIEEQFIKGNKFNSMTELNSLAKEFIITWCKEVHGTTKRIPEEAHKEELPHLIPLPTTRFMVNTLEKRKVSLDSLVSFGGRKFSVPVEYVSKLVHCRLSYGYKLEVYSLEMQLIAVHEVKSIEDKIQRLEDHYSAIIQPAPKSVPEIKRLFQASFTNGTIYLEQAARVLQQPSYHAREILKLRELYSTESLDMILNFCIENQLYSSNEFKKVLKEQYIELVLSKRDVENTQTKMECFGDTPLLRSLSYYEGGGQI